MLAIYACASHQIPTRESADHRRMQSSYRWLAAEWPAVVQAVGTLVAIVVAIAVPASQEWLRRRGERDQLLARRRAAWTTMVAVVELLGDKKVASLAEIDGPAAVLDQLDLAVFPAEAVDVLVGVRSQVALARGIVLARCRTDNAGLRVEFEFDAGPQLHNLSTIREIMGFADSHVLGARRPLTVPFYPGRRAHL